MNRIKLLALGAALAIPAIGAVGAGAAGSNLILNGTFDNSVAGWDNYGGHPTLYKSTMQITNDYAGAGNSSYSGWTCVGVKAGKEYTVEADYWVPEDAPKNAGASLALHYYESANCSGPNMVTGGGYQSGGKVALQRGNWQHFSFESTAPAGAKSVRVRATALKEPQGGGSIAAEHKVYFDNVSMRAEQIVIVLPTATPTQPKGPDDIAADPTPPQPPSNPDDLSAEPEPTQPPSNPDDLSANPDPTQPPSDPGDAPSNSADAPAGPEATPAAPNTGNHPVDVIPQGQPGKPGSESGPSGSPVNHNVEAADEDGGSIGLGLGIIFLAAGGAFAAVGMSLAAIARRRRGEEPLD